jgi:hypothetical protein
MPRPRKPTVVHEMLGSYRANPQRRPRSEPRPDELGPAPTHLSPQERAAWAEVLACLPHGVAMASDAPALELLVRLLTQARRDPEFPAAKMNTLLSLISRFGMTPSDRSRVVAEPPEPEEDPAARFFS